MWIFISSCIWIRWSLIAVPAHHVMRNSNIINARSQIPDKGIAACIKMVFLCVINSHFASKRLLRVV
jgi:hypothetical protein